MSKNFVLDTNVLLHDPQSIFKFQDNQVIIPIYVLEEVDQFKKELSERGRNAREIARRLDQLRGACAPVAALAHHGHRDTYTESRDLRVPC